MSCLNARCVDLAVTTKQTRPSSLKQRIQKFLITLSDSAGKSRDSNQKVFWSFFSKKDYFPSIMQSRGGLI
jgi:hypothetical protein